MLSSFALTTRKVLSREPSSLSLPSSSSSLPSSLPSSWPPQAAKGHRDPPWKCCTTVGKRMGRGVSRGTASSSRIVVSPLVPKSTCYVRDKKNKPGNTENPGDGTGDRGQGRGERGEGAGGRRRGRCVPKKCRKSITNYC